MNTKTNLKIISALVLLSVVCNISQAKFLMPQAVPVDRLITNATAYIKENPKDAQGYYILARINYLAFINKSTQAPAFNEGKDTPPKVAETWQEDGFLSRTLQEHARKLAAEEMGYTSASSVPANEREKYRNLYSQKVEELRRQNWLPDGLNQSGLIKHLTSAFDNFDKAIKLDSKNALYHLGLASLYEQYLEFAKNIDPNVISQELKKININQAIEEYFTAYELSIEENLKLTSKPISGLESLVGYEAGRAYVRLIESDKNPSNEQKKKLSQIQKNIDKLDKLPTREVTPIIFTLEKTMSPANLLERDLQVNFDLDGDGASELWPWVKPSTGILVWNEDGKGEITSGRQLFGSVTWWLFFNDGYHALDCLDDNRDGSLSGDELKGISVWFDTNSNGKSESGEIKSLDELGIISISTKSTSTENGWPANKTGIILKTGQIIPTYDWIAKPFSK